MYTLAYKQYGFESTWSTNNLGKALARYYRFKKFIEPTAPVWLEKDGEVIWERD